jgi:hypothetical protein
MPKDDSPIPREILENPKFFPYFAGALGAIDGTHINCCPSADERHLARNQKGGVSQNCLACCSFDLRFQYILSGWDGSVSDAMLFNEARLTDLCIPKGKYYLADAGFGICEALLVPHRNVRYHLAEWGRAAVRLKFQASNLFTNSYFLLDQKIHMNCTIYDMPKHEMSLNGFSVYSRDGFQYS